MNMSKHSNHPARILGAVAFLFLGLIPVWSQPAVTVVAGAPAGTIMPGQAVVMGVTATGTQLGYQWKLNGTNIPGATAATYSLKMAGAADRGTYQVVVTGSGGVVTMDMGTIAGSPSDAKLVNLSARAGVGAGGNVMIMGFVTQGDANATNKNMLLRGMGPALTGMGGMMSGLLANPVLTVYDSQSKPMASDMGWMNALSRATGSGASTVTANVRAATMDMMNAVGAYAPASGSTDSALMMSPPLGACTAILSDANNVSGVGLVECYDADGVLNNGTNTARLMNLSARAWVGTGANVLIAGFVVAAGPAGLPETVLLRAMGPGLASLGVDGVLAGPTMTLYDSNSKPIASNTGWGNAPVMAGGNSASPVLAGIGAATMGVMTRIGAFSPVEGSADCALVATLPPGSYTVIVSGLPDNAGRPMTGVCLVEVYELR